MRTDVKIGIAAVLLLSVAALVYFVFGSAKPKSAPPSEVVIAPPDANRSHVARPPVSPPIRPTGLPPRAEPNRSPSFADAALRPGTPAGRVDISTVRPPDDGLRPLVGPDRIDSTTTRPARTEPLPFELTRLDSPRSEAPTDSAARRPPSLAMRRPEDTRLEPVLVSPLLPRTEGPAIEEVRGPGTTPPAPAITVDVHGRVIRKPDGKDYYVVKKGDNGLWAVSEKVYGQGRKWDIIARANPGADLKPLQPGQELLIPPLVDVSTERPLGLTRTPTTGPAPQGRYAVKSGDTLEAIAGRQYGDKTLWHAIAQANPAVDPRRLRIGQELTIPSLEEARRMLGVSSSTTRPAVARDTTPRPAPAAARSSGAGRGGRVFD